MQSTQHHEYLFEKDYLDNQVRVIASDVDSTHEDMRAFKLSQCEGCQIHYPHDCRYGIWRGTNARSALTGTRFGALELIENR